MKKSTKKFPALTFFTCFIVLFTFFITISAKAQTGYSHSDLENIKNELHEIFLINDAYVSYPVNKKKVNRRQIIHNSLTSLISSMNYSVSGKNGLLNITLIPTTIKTYYDLQSNSTPSQIIQDPLRPNNIHAIFMTALQTDFSDRSMKYSFSSDGGATWHNLGNVPPAGATSGFGTVSVLSDGVAVIGLHTSLGGAPARTQFFVDAFTGLGSFTNYDPGIIGLTFGNIWPRFVPIAGSTSSNPGFVWVASINGQDSTFRNRYFNSAYSGYQSINARQAESYSVARGDDGRIGILYRTKDVTNYGGMEFMESTDNGATWSTPLRIFNGIILGGDTVIGALRGVSLAYQGNTPVGVFEIARQLSTGSYFPTALESQIRFWSPVLPGNDPNRSIPIAVIDTVNPVILPNGVPFAPSVGVNDVYTNLCRPTIGVSSDGTAVFVAMLVASKIIGGSVDSTTFRDVYFTFSSNGLSWFKPEKVTPDIPRRDWTYPSISPINVPGQSDYEVFMNIQSDSIPGSFINGGANGPSLAQQNIMKISFPRSTGIPSSPTLLFPVPGASNLQTPVTLRWRPVLNANSYKVQVSLSSDFTTLFLDSSITVPEQILNNSGNMLPNTTYYWRVRCDNIYGSSSWSEIRSFTTGIITEVDPVASELPNEYSLHNNFPNPFNPNTTIKFDLKEDGVTTLKLYDVLGREVRTVLNQFMQRGRHEISFNSDGLASGVYFYTLSVNNFVSTKKMLLSK